jgi:clan AA aspartic protease
MMIGRFLPSREFAVELTLRDLEGEPIELTAVVDTGFSGFLTVPFSVLERLGLSQTDTEEATLADGSVLRFGVYEVTLDWDEDERTVPVYATESAALLGISMLLGSIGTFEFIEGGTVTIETAE